MKLSVEDRIKLMKAIESYPIENQRQLSEIIQLSLGKTNYLLRNLIGVGLVKLSNFKRSDNKIGYTYKLTPKGISEKVRITVEFLERKEEEYLLLRKEIKSLKIQLERDLEK